MDESADTPLYCLANARHEAQRQQMIELEAAGRCVFCPPWLDDPDDPLVVYRGEHWTVRTNAYPYRDTLVHVLLIPHAHVTDLADVPPEAYAEWWQVLAWAKQRYGLTSYGMGVRCGDFTHTGGTIAHVHVHLVVGDTEADDFRPIRLKLSSRPGQE